MATADPGPVQAGPPKKVCIVGGGASAAGLLWCLAKAQQLGLTTDTWSIRLIHDDTEVGGHSRTVEVPMNGKNVALDTGVQMIAPSMYPGLMSMLDLPEFAPVEMQHVDLHISCTFPPEQGQTPFWGNFPEYQKTGLYGRGAPSATVFQKLLSAASLRSDPVEMLETVQTFLDRNASAFPSPGALTLFTDYFLDPYMSIMNGYGAARLATTALIDIAALWDLGYASFTTPTEGYARFAHGAQSWVQQMVALAQKQFGSALSLTLNSRVVEIAPNPPNPVNVTWADTASGTTTSETFDIVVSTLEMQANSGVLDSPRNTLWSSLYEPCIGSTTGMKFGTSVWPLIPGYCYIHQDPSVLAPGMPTPLLETLQMNASYAGDGHGGFDLIKTYTTYIESNLLGITLNDPADEWYLTMYGFEPSQYGIKPPSTTPGHTFEWVHGMWMPTFMVEQKLAFHKAQSTSPHQPARPGQQGTGLYFAGNNLTMDSEEGALMSGMCIAKYAFGINAMLTLLPPLGSVKDLETWGLAWAEFGALYALMFPPLIGDSPSTVDSLESLLVRLSAFRR
jgi:NAD(P)-binding Rossmann-like domain